MHIAYIAADRGTPVFGSKGASNHIRAMVNAFTALGHRVTVLAARRGDHQGQLGAEVLEFEGEVALDLSYAATEADKTAAKEQRSLQMADCIEQRLQEIHRQTPFDLIYERYTLFSRAGVRAARRLGIPCLVEVNAPLIEEQSTHRKLQHAQLATEVRNQVFRQAASLLVVSEPLVGYAEQAGACRGNIHVHPNGVDTGTFHPEVAPLPIEGLGRRRVIGFSGSLKPWHGLEVLLESFARLRSLDVDCHLLIVGEGPLRGWLEGYACGAGFADRLSITGWVDSKDVARWIRTMDVAVAPYPADDNFYFSPLKLFEYMAVGTPVVASDIGQIADVVRHDKTGLLCPPGDAEQFASAILRVLREPGLGMQLGQAAAREASKRDWCAVAQRVIDLAARHSRAA